MVTLLDGYSAAVDDLTAIVRTLERERDEAVEIERKRVLDGLAADLKQLTGIDWEPTKGATLGVLLKRHVAARLAEVEETLEPLFQAIEECHPQERPCEVGSYSELHIADRGYWDDIIAAKDKARAALRALRGGA